MMKNIHARTYLEVDVVFSPKLIDLGVAIVQGILGLQRQGKELLLQVFHDVLLKGVQPSRRGR